MSTHFQETIEKVLEGNNRLEIFQNDPEFYVRLDMPGYARLVVEQPGESIIVERYFRQNGDLMADPEVGLHFPTWSPIAIAQILGRRRVEFTERGGQTQVDTRFRDEVTSFLSTWAEKIRNQGWEERAKVTHGNP